MSARTFAFRPWLLAGMLRPVVFGLAIAAAVLAGDRSGSFWIGLLAFLVAMGAGRVLRRLIRGRGADAVHAALWPAAAVGFAFLFVDAAGLPQWAGAILAIVVAGIAKNVLSGVFLPERRSRWRRLEEWGIPTADDVVEGRATRKP